MVDYVKTFVIAGTVWGIEDYTEPGDHFFPEEFKAGKRKRFQCWVGGCGCGQASTITEAYAIIKEYALQKLDNELGLKILRIAELDSTMRIITEKGLDALSKGETHYDSIQGRRRQGRSTDQGRQAAKKDRTHGRKGKAVNL